MTENLTRVPAKIFAENAPQNVVGQFGSALNGTKVNTTDVNIIQGLSAYTTGWSSAVISNRNYPTLEEMNGVMKTMSYQTAYNMQKGVAEWDNQTTYYTGDICKAVGSGVLYVSRADNNIGNPVSNTTYWQEYQGAQTSIPATNYIYAMDGNATYNNLSVTLPDMTLYIADGRSGNNSVNNNVVNVTSDTYTVSGNGEYTLFYNNTTQDLHLAPEYTVRVNDFPEGANYNDVCYKLDNRMYVVETINPNYSESAGVTVSDAGVVSGLGTLSLVFNGSMPLQPVLNLDFITGADVTTTQDLFSTPYAVGKISNGVFTTDLYSLAYSVDYYPQVYSGAYTLESQTVTYKYSINNTTYYTNSIIQVGSNLYTDEGLTTLYGTVTNLQNNTVTVSDIQTAYSGSFTQVSSGSYYTYDLGGTNYYTLVPIASGVVVYTDTDTTDVFGTVTSVTGSTVLIQNTTQLYSGTYDDVTTSVYTYLLTSGPVYIYSAGVLIPGLTVYSDNTLTTAYGVVETITTSNVVIHSQNDSAGYVAQAGSGSVASGVSIYSDVNLQTLVATSTGANSTYTGSNTKSKVGTINYNVSASTQYSGSLEYNGTSYNLVLNGVSSSFITSRNPYVDVQPAISFGGTNGFDGTIDISNMNMPNVWTWNGHNTTTPDWNVEPLCELGKITIENGAISDLKINYPIELVKFSDLEHLNLPQGGGGSGYQLFDIVMKDHVLSYAETLGLAPLGTYVYKEAIAGTRYGYPDFYQKCVDEYNASSPVDETFEQPVLTANGTMGGSSFAVEASSYCSSPDRNAYKSFDGNNTTKWGVDRTTSGWLTFYNPQALKVSSIVYTPSTDYPGEDGGDLEISGSNDNSTWTSLWTGSYTANSTQTFNVDSQAYYNYYRITITNGVSNRVGLGDLTINATYLADYVENSNKHRFYDIADKATFDNIFGITGECWYYGIDTTNERIFLPRSTRFKNGTTSDVGGYQAAGLPNITGYFVTGDTTDCAGAFYGNGNRPGGTQAGGSSDHVYGFDASLSNVIYGASNTVEYSSTKLIPYMVVGNTANESAVTDVVDVTTTENDTLPLFTGIYFDYAPNNVSWVIAGGQVVSGTIYTFAYNELVSELTTPKYNLNVIDVNDMVVGTDYSTYWKVDQTNQTFTCPIRTSERVLVAKKEATDDDPTWYNLYSDGWCEQGSQVTISSTGVTTVSLVKEFKNTNYIAFKNYGSNKSTGAADYEISIFNQTTNSFDWRNDSSDTNLASWTAKGYTAIPTISDYTEPLRMYFKVANAVQNLELLDAGAVLTAVNNVSAKVDNTVHIIETYENGMDAYTVWSNGYCIQSGGFTTSSQWTTNNITFLRRFKNEYYSIFTTPQVSTKDYASGVNNKTATGFTSYVLNVDGMASWSAFGKLAEGEY